MANARPGPDDPELEFATQDAWTAWLEEHHGDASGVWLRLAKKDSGLTSVDYAQALEVALCFGWIDGQSRRLDDRYWVQRFTPRRARSRWSRINRQKATELIERDLMRPAGLAEVERAQADGRWEAAYDSPRTAEVPDDLRAALAANPRADAFFATLNGRNRYAILHRIQEAKRPETRARRIEKFITMLADHRTLYP